MKNLFGTDGIRATIGTEPFTKTTLPQLTDAIAYWINNLAHPCDTIAIAMDTRKSCLWIKTILQESLQQIRCTIFDMGVLPTPILQYLMKHQNIMIGFMISASHNTYEDNGIKIFYRGEKIHEFDKAVINQAYYNKQKLKNFKKINVSIVSADVSPYHTYLTTIFQPNFLSYLRIVLDCANGALWKLAPDIFTQFGAQVHTLNNRPDGKNINALCGSTYPKTLSEAVVACHADIGFAFDGDGDRVIAVNRFGQIKDGDDLLAILVQHPLYVTSHTVVGTIMTNEGLITYIRSFDKKLIRVPVGDVHISEALQVPGRLLGGEQSGHIIMKDYAHTSDGIMTALRILQTLRATDNQDFDTFTKYPQLLTNIPIKKRISLDSASIQNVIQIASEHLPHGRIIVRYSGTEPILRVMIEDADIERVCNIHAYVVSALQNIYKI